LLLVQQHIYKPSHKDYKTLDNICFLSKNLYNATLYAVRQYFFENKKYLSYFTVNKQFTYEDQVDYRMLPAKVSKMVQKEVENNFKSFFALLKNKTRKKNIPRYLPKDGRFATTYTKQALSLVKEGYVKLSKTDIFIKTSISKEQIQFVRIVPFKKHITVEIGYKVKEKQFINNDSYASIDLGLNNLMTVTSTSFKPFIINGKPLKSINQYYNKQKAYYQSILEKQNGKKTSNRLKFLSLKRNNKIKDYLHRTTTYLVNQLDSNHVTTLVVGYNKNWKQDINLGKKNNQNFVNIPFYKLVNMLGYKCLLKGIKLVLQEESYTSKCSFLDKEEIKKHKNYLGKRVKRGLFKTSENIYINADVNGSYNILKKYLTKETKDIYNYINLVEVCSTPLKVTLKSNFLLTS